MTLTPGAQVTIDSAAPVSLTFSTSAPQTVTVDVLENSDDNLARVALITHTIISSDAAEYPTSLCEAHNFDEGGVV